MTREFSSQFFNYLMCALLLILLTTLLNACSALHPVETAPPTFYSLDYPTVTQSPPNLPVHAPTLLVTPPIAASGFDSQRIIYTRTSHQLEYFAHSEWIDTPARMIAPLIVDALANSGAFRAVAPATSAAAGGLRLNTEIVRLQHDFGTQPSQLRFTLRAYVLDNATRKVLAWHEFDEVVVATSDTPYDGIVAANRAVQAGLQELTGFCADAARLWVASKDAERIKE
jgi:cholesterol transport system auxiliary component